MPRQPATIRTRAEGVRPARLADIAQGWDVVVVGGGISGAGIARAAARAGLRALLLEQSDFASGTSSRSSKLVHGGLRYLATGQPRLTYASVRERERLVEELPGLVERIGFLMPTYRGDRPGRWTYEAGLTAYDMLAAGRTHHRYHGRSAFELLAPHIRLDGLRGGFRFEDAVTDDSRLTLRVIFEAEEAGATALNYVAAEAVLRDASGAVGGVAARDMTTGECLEVKARAVVNATGAWADTLRGQLGERRRIRPLRGSHLAFPAWRLPVAQVVSFLHPLDRRPVFLVPWEGVTLYGTTDVDAEASTEPSIAADERDYLLAGVQALFPSLGLGIEDVVSTMAGIRPVIDTGKADPSKESRDHAVWQEYGLLTVTGGKLTTVELIARDVMRAIRRSLGVRGPSAHDASPAGRVAPAVPAPPPSVAGRSLDADTWRRLAGRYGDVATDVVEAAHEGELETVAGTPTTWVELRWAARRERVVHLDDLLLRRTRLGLLLPAGAAAWLPAIRAIAQAELGWDDGQWAAEAARYRALWSTQHAPDPVRAAVAGEAPERVTPGTAEASE